jgi:hypothetical protein
MFTPKVFNWSFPYEYQVSTELLKANENFTAIANAFIDSDIENQPIKRAVYIASQSPDDAVKGTLWLDTSSDPAILKLYDGSNWICITIVIGVCDEL